MTKTKTISVFAIVAIAAMMGAASIAPAYAAEKTTDYKTQDEYTVESGTDICGEEDVIITIFFNYFEKEWSNGHFKYHEDAQYNIYSLDWELVGTVPIVSDNYQGNWSDGPLSFNYNFGGDGLCVDGSTITGFESYHCGATVQKDGDEIIHSIECI